MSGLTYTYTRLIAEVTMSNKAYILVEGSDDKEFFEDLKRHRGQNRQLGTDTTIMSAEILRSEDPGEGNRTKVERVCDLIVDSDCATRFVAFVDREWRGFRLGRTITDDLGYQHHEGRLIWSRGHSIENYMFEYDVAGDALYPFTLSSVVANKALELLRENFTSILNMGCAIGLAARDVQCLERARGSIGPEQITLSDRRVGWEVQSWRDWLMGNSPLDEATIIRLIERYQHWLEVVQKSDPVGVRWACDGHIGLKFIWSSYAILVYHASLANNEPGPKPSTERSAVLSINERARFKQMVEKWLRKWGDDVVDTPGLCFNTIGRVS